MNVKDLILSQPAADIAAALIDRLDIEPGKCNEGIRRITALIDILRGMPTCIIRANSPPNSRRCRTFSR